MVPSVPAVTPAREACPASGRAWLALCVRPRYVARIRATFKTYAIETFYPCSTVETHWSDRTKRSERPWFPGYLFVRCDPEQKSAVISTAGVIQILPTNLDPTPIADSEIANLLLVAASPAPVLPCPYVPGETVLVDHGPLSGIEGVIQTTRGATQLVVRIPIFNRSVAVEIDVANVKPMPKAA